MEVLINCEDNILNVKVSGRLDTTTAPELERQLRDYLSDAKEIAFDFADLEYISSAGLRVVIIAVQALKGEGDVKVANLADEVREVFELTGLIDVLAVE